MDPTTPPGDEAAGPASADAAAAAAVPSKRRRRVFLALKVFVAVAAVWLLLAYVILPALWRHYEHRPELEDTPKTTVTAQGIPGDPLNVGLVGGEEDVVRAMLAAGWFPADPITLRSSVKIAGSVLLRRPYEDAPVSSLFVFGRKQDLAFEKPDGESAARRHHVRFWEVEGTGPTRIWVGAVTYDRSVGLSRTTGQITHHIGPDVDAERNALIAGLREHGLLTQIYQVTGVGATLVGHNGGGDLYYTDGELTLGVIAAVGSRGLTAETLPNPPAVRVKDQLWSAIRPLLKSLPGN